MYKINIFGTSNKTEISQIASILKNCNIIVHEHPYHISIKIEGNIKSLSEFINYVGLLQEHMYIEKVSCDTDGKI